VVNATGVWAATLADGISLTPSRGSHLVLDAATVGLCGAGLTVPVPHQPNRYVLMLPAPQGRVYLGLTDERVDGPVPDVPVVPDHDVDFLLSTASTVLDRRTRIGLVPAERAAARPAVADLTPAPARGGWTICTPLLVKWSIHPKRVATHPALASHPVQQGLSTARRVVHR